MKRGENMLSAEGHRDTVSLHIGTQGRADSPERNAEFSGRQFAPGDDRTGSFTQAARARAVGAVPGIADREIRCGMPRRSAARPRQFLRTQSDRS
jgi:hypothetical protein